jgi:adenylate cyclase
MGGRDDGNPMVLTRNSQRLRFDRYILDFERGCLLLDGTEVPLRPKTFAVLCYLVENSGRLVPKDDLFAAVWPNLAITDDALVQSIGELRRSLGDDGPRLIKTIPRRGYRFESDVTADDPSQADAPPTLPRSHDNAERRKTATRAPTTKWWLTAAPLGWRKVSLVLFGLAMIVGAGSLWSGIGADGKFLNGLGYGASSKGQSAAIGATPAIAVLPFLNQSDEPGRDYFADGLTQDVINALGRFSALTVMSWNAVFPYKGKPTTPKEIGRDLAVRYLVEGSVRQVGDRVRLTAQLADTKHGQVLWSARFDEALADVFALQDKITTQIVAALAIRVTQIEQQRVLAKPTESLEAYDYMLRARPALQRPTRTNNVEARALLHRAIQLDPNYAAAYAALGETYHIALSMGWAQSPTAYLKRAEQFASKALSLNELEVRAHIILGRIDIFRQQFKQAEVELERAAAINPNDAQGLAGRGNILLWLGQTDAAIAALERAQHIDPELNAIDRFALSLAYYLKRRYDAAIEQAELNLQKTAGANFSRVLLAAAYAQQNRRADAARTVAMIRRVDPTFDPQGFGTKFLNPADLEHLRDGFRKAGLYAAKASLPSPASNR